MKCTTRPLRSVRRPVPARARPVRRPAPARAGRSAAHRARHKQPSWRRRVVARHRSIAQIAMLPPRAQPRLTPSPAARRSPCRATVARTSSKLCASKCARTASARWTVSPSSWPRRLLSLGGMRSIPVRPPPRRHPMMWPARVHLVYPYLFAFYPYLFARCLPPLPPCGHACSRSGNHAFIHVLHVQALRAQSLCHRGRWSAAALGGLHYRAVCACVHIRGRAARRRVGLGACQAEGRGSKQRSPQRSEHHAPRACALPCALPSSPISSPPPHVVACASAGFGRTRHAAAARRRSCNCGMMVALTMCARMAPGAAFVTTLTSECSNQDFW